MYNLQLLYKYSIEKFKSRLYSNTHKYFLHKKYVYNYSTITVLYSA